MKKVLVNAVLVAFVVMAFAVNANASIITFTHEGTGSYSLDGSSFVDAAFTITAYGDTTNQDTHGYGFFIDHDYATIDITGLGTLAFATGTRTFVNTANDIVGFSRAGSGGLDLFNGPTDVAFG